MKSLLISAHPAEFKTLWAFVVPEAEFRVHCQNGRKIIDFVGARFAGDRPWCSRVGFERPEDGTNLLFSSLL